MTFDEIEATLPWGLHDAYLEGLAIDWMDARLELTLRLMMSTRQDKVRRARITVRGLVYCAIDPPEIDPERNYEPVPEAGLWIDAGSGAVEPSAESRLPKTPAGSFRQWIFVRDWNRYIYVCGKEAMLTWLDPAPLPSSETRAYFAGDVIPDPKSSRPSGG